MRGRQEQDCRFPFVSQGSQTIHQAPSGPSQKASSRVHLTWTVAPQKLLTVLSFPLLTTRSSTFCSLICLVCRNSSCHDLSLPLVMRCKKATHTTNILPFGVHIKFWHTEDFQRGALGAALAGAGMLRQHTAAGGASVAGDHRPCYLRHHAAPALPEGKLPLSGSTAMDTCLRPKHDWPLHTEKQSKF